ncbi:hypothetical protein ACIA5C_18095 [Actinoplanes sp. NPDC051343]|uniref:hypothetical protein n=1 Tax=Actinoplanes sp. NPDC051343 TaxID=3363906 RepID=UPI0037A585DC
MNKSRRIGAIVAMATTAVGVASMVASAPASAASRGPEPVSNWLRPVRAFTTNQVDIYWRTDRPVCDVQVRVAARGVDVGYPGHRRYASFNRGNSLRPGRTDYTSVQINPDFDRPGAALLRAVITYDTCGFHARSQSKTFTLTLPVLRNDRPGHDWPGGPGNGPGGNGPGGNDHGQPGDNHGAPGGNDHGQPGDNHGAPGGNDHGQPGDNHGQPGGPGGNDHGQPGDNHGGPGHHHLPPTGAPAPTTSAPAPANNNPAPATTTPAPATTTSSAPNPGTSANGTGDGSHHNGPGTGDNGGTGHGHGNGTGGTGTGGNGNRG